MNKLKLDNIGGLPFDQQVLEYMQDSYSKPLGALARLCGDKTIISGVFNDGLGNISDGWIAYQGELLPFVAGPIAARVQISEVVTAYVFEDANSYPVEFKRYAELVSIGGNFDFADLQPLSQVLDVTNKLAKITHYVSYCKTGEVIGNIGFYAGAGSPDSVIPITIPDQGTDDYVVAGSLRGLQADADYDNDVMWVVSDKTATGFNIAIREMAAVAQDLVFDFTITKAI